MPVLSFYLLDIRPGRPWRRIALSSIDHMPTDWIELKTMLEELMWQVYMEHGYRTEALISLERHLRAGIMERWTQKYGRTKVATRRSEEALFRLEFDPETHEITVKEAQFSYHLSRLREDFLYYERDRELTLPPLIPRQHMNLNDPRSFLMEPSALRFTDYTRKPNPMYAYEQEHHRLSYAARTPKISYERGRRRLYEEEEEEFR
jgi:hypothetical protein